MSQGGSESRTVGLPQNSTTPNMGGLGIGGGIYGNPFQVNQLSQPSMMQGGSGLMRSPFNPMNQGQQIPPGGQLLNQMNLMNQMQQMPLMGQGQPMQPGGQLFNQMQAQQGGSGLMRSPFNQFPARPAYIPPGGQLFNQMQAGLGSLVPGNYAMRPSDPPRYQPVINAAPI